MYHQRTKQKRWSNQHSADYALPLHTPLSAPDFPHVGVHPEELRTLQHFLGTTHKGMWKLLFKAQKRWPMETEDVGLDAKNLATLVSVWFSKDISGLCIQSI